MFQSKSEKRTLLTRKKLLVLAFSLVLLAVVFTGASFAYLKMNSGAVQNTFSKGSVGAEISEVFSGTEKTSITVTNTGDSPAYVRVRLVTYWQNTDGSIPVKSEQPSISFTLNSDNWTQKYGYYYYTSALAGCDTTENLLKSSIQMQEGQVIDVLAEVVQATPSDAVKAVWGIDASSFVN